ncbi:hypothetical protein [Nocardia sp. XZ_19_369]|uniref:hypothetical protein n=1 Tax=Nocardia sp. XZ_19_369 TaxID=2769487 RepID=UPI0018904049|nr:hypothetical protein [Nocardia sp. XZ_19_369]
MPLDGWRARNFAQEPYLHAVGFNADESRRIEKDSSVTIGGQRHPIYPLHAAGWSRARCQGYLFGLFGVWWPKSCCRQCCFVSEAGWPEQLDRFREMPAEAFDHLVDEYVAVALNRNSGLFGPGRSLTDRLRRDDAEQVLSFAAAALDRCRWAVYRVRRCYSGPGKAWRSVETTLRGSRAEVVAFLDELAAHVRVRPTVDGEHIRVWLTPPLSSYPRIEEFFTIAPDSVTDKQRPGFETRWHGHADTRLLAMETAALTYARTRTAA